MSQDYLVRMSEVGPSYLRVVRAKGQDEAVAAARKDLKRQLRNDGQEHPRIRVDAVEIEACGDWESSPARAEPDIDLYPPDGIRIYV